MRNYFVKMVKNKYLVVLFLIVFLSLVLNLNKLNSVLIAEGDAYSRALISKNQADNHVFFNFKESGAWLPFHYSILTIPQFIGFDAFYGQRLITLIISSLSIVPLYFYTKEYFKNKNTAILASFIFAIFPLRIFLSTQPLSESVFLFFFISAIYFLIKEKSLDRNLLISLLFFNFAHAIRYESWLILPLIWLYLAMEQKINIRKKVAYFLFSILFPMYWLLNSFILSGSYLSFFNEKREMAQKSFIPEFYNFNLSYFAWEKQLIKIFPIPFLIIVFTKYKDLFVKINLKKMVFYILPIYLYGLLVLQVYFGTMEWFPHRYLLIPVTFLIPILAEALRGIFVSFIKIMRKKIKIVYKVIVSLMFFSLLFSSVSLYQKSYKDTKHFLITRSFLNSLPYIPKSLDDSIYYHDFVEIKEEIIKMEANYIEFYFRNIGKSWNAEALFYLTDIGGKGLDKRSFIDSHVLESTIVWEREFNKLEPIWLDEFNILFENDNYSILEYKLKEAEADIK